MAQRDFDMRVSTIEVAEEEEMAEMKNEVRKRERGAKERMGPKGDSSAAFLLLFLTSLLFLIPPTHCGTKSGGVEISYHSLPCGYELRIE